MLTSKQRAYLRSLATDSETILMIGKGQISPEIIKQADDALIARELIKCKVLETHENSVKDVSIEIANQTNSDVVCVIGSKFVLFRQNPKNPTIKLPRSK